MERWSPRTPLTLWEIKGALTAAAVAGRRSGTPERPGKCG